MIYSSEDMQTRAVLDTAARMCAAARTAPKTRGMDGLVTCVVTGEDKDRLAAHMRELAGRLDYAFFARDADNVDYADAVVLFGMEEQRRGLNGGCQYCHFADCADCAEKNGLCAWDAMDVGIAIGAAVPVLLSSLGASVKGKRTAYVYLLIDVIGALVWGVVFFVAGLACLSDSAAVGILLILLAAANLANTMSA